MKIEFLISTMNRSDLSFLEKMFQNLDLNTIQAIVINQCTTIMPTEIKSPYSGVNIISVTDRGLARSRNLALDNCSGDICVIADDDVVYTKHSLSLIEETFANESIDIAKFQIETPEGKLYKNYSTDTVVNTLRNALSTSSIEIVFRKKSIVEKAIVFDSRFGLGAQFKGSEDVIFISDCIKQKLNVLSIPKPFVIHPLESSGTDYRSDNQELVLNIGAMMTRVFGVKKSVLLLIVFTIKRYRLYKNAFSCFSFLKLLLQGRKKYITKEY